MDNTIRKTIKNSDGSTSLVEISSNDNYFVNIGNNYKLIRFNNNNKKSFKDTILGGDIGINNHGFVSMTLTALVIAISVFAILMYSFRI